MSQDDLGPSRLCKSLLASQALRRETAEDCRMNRGLLWYCIGSFHASFTVQPKSFIRARCWHCTGSPNEVVNRERWRREVIPAGKDILGIAPKSFVFRSDGAWEVLF